MPAPAQHYDLVRTLVASAPGTSSTISLGVAVSGYRDFTSTGANVPDGTTVIVGLSCLAGTETLNCTYNKTPNTLTINSVISSTNGGTEVNAGADAIVFDSLSASELTKASYATASGSALNPTGNTTSTALMMGCGATFTITPVSSGRVLFKIQAQIDPTGTTNYVNFLLYYGSGTAPAHGAAVTGTQIGPPWSFGANYSSGENFAVSVTGLVTGLIPGTAYWFDFAINDGTAYNVVGIAAEL